MKLIDPRLTVQMTDGNKIVATVELSDDPVERLAFTVVIESAPVNQPARSVPQVLVAACEAARNILDAVIREQSGGEPSA